MKAIILASGNGLRFLPLSKTNPKPLTKLFGKSIIEHNLLSLKGIVDEVFIVIGYLGEKIKEAIGDNYNGIKITYVIDNEIIGTGNSARLAVAKIKDDKVIIMNGDDLYNREDVKALVQKCPSIAAKKVLNPSNFGIIIIEEGKVKEIEEKPDDPKSNLANIGLYCLPTSVFNEPISKSKRGEYEITDYVKNLNYIEASAWVPASYPWDLFSMVELLFQDIKGKNLGKIEKNVILKNKVYIGGNTIIKSGSYIEGSVFIGDNCKIGPNVYIRENTVIEDNCSIGAGVEIKNSIIGKNTKINHLSYVGDSILGENVNLGAGTITANLRHDGNTIKTLANNVLIDTKRQKFGTVIGDNVKTGVSTVIFPGKKIWPNKITYPQEKVEKDLI